MLKARAGILLGILSMFMVAIGQPAAQAAPQGPGAAVGAVTGHVLVNPGVVSAQSDPIATTYTFTKTVIAGTIATAAGDVAVGAINVTATGASPEENALESSGSVTVTALATDLTLPHQGTVLFNPNHVANEVNGYFIRVGPVVLVQLTLDVHVVGPLGGAGSNTELQVLVAAAFVPLDEPLPITKQAAFAGVFLGASFSS